LDKEYALRFALMYASLICYLGITIFI